MADRIMYAGDTYPSALFQVSDETGVLNLSTAVSITVRWEGKQYKFSGAGTAIWPVEMDPTGEFGWNLSYAFAAGDTANPDIYTPFIVVTWSAGPPAEIETFPTTDTLTVLAAPA